MSAVPFPLAQGALMAHLDRANQRTVADVVRDVQRAQSQLMSANSPRLAQVFRLRLRRLADELATRTGGTLTAGPL